MPANEASAQKSPLRLLEAVATQPSPVVIALQVQLPGGARLEISDASQIPLASALIAALEKSC